MTKKLPARWFGPALALCLIATPAAAQEALLIQDSNPWGYTAWQSELATAAVPYTQIGNASVSTTQLELYDLVITSSVQGSSSNTTLNGLITEFEDYVTQGGILIWSGCTQSSDSPYPEAPFGGTNNYGADSNNVVMDPAHPLLLNVVDPIYGSSASHNYWTDLPVDAEILVTHSSNANPILYVLYRGNGLVIASTHTWEHGWGNGYGAGTVLANAVYWGWTVELCDDVDLDGDGYTDCDGDCNDNDPSLTPADVDMDGFSSCDGDCDDGRANVYPGCDEICDDYDNNCDGTIDEGFDYDYDGYTTCGAEVDCDDYNAGIHPGATEVPYDHIDQDCDGYDLTDIDMDGFDAAEAGGTDCDDQNAAIYPDAPEICDTGLDDDCHGAPDDYDDDCAEGGDDDSAGYDGDYTPGIICQCNAVGEPRVPGLVVGLIWLVFRRLRRPRRTAAPT